MQSNNISRFVCFAAISAVLALPALLRAQSPWLLPAGEGSLSTGASFSAFDKFFVGTTEMTLPADIKQRSLYATFEYGIAPRWALDLSLGHTETKFDPPGANFRRGGIDDTHFGLSYALLEESGDTPAVAVRLGAIIKGGYSVLNSLPPINPGDGANGFEVSLLAGKTLAEGFSVYGELGYRNRSDNVPDDFDFVAGLGKRIGDVNLNIAYRRTAGQTGGDIGGPGFGSTFGFQQVKEVSQSFEGGVSYTDSGGRSYSFLVAKKFGSLRNTGKATIYSIGISVPFRF